MNIKQIISNAINAGVVLYQESGLLKYKLIKGEFPSELKSLIVSHKEEIIRFLMENDSSDTIYQAPFKVDNENNGELVLSYEQERFWFIDQLEESSTHYNVPFAVEIQGSFDLEIAKVALSRVVERHHILRTTYHENSDGPFQRVNEYDTGLELKVLDFSKEASASKERMVKDAVGMEFLTAFDLESDLMIRGTWIQKQEDVGVFVVVLHHIASDNHSSNILLKEFFENYQSIKLGNLTDLPELTLQYSDFAQWQRDVSSEQLKVQLAFWQDKLKGMPVVHNLPLDHPRPEQQTFAGDFQRSTLPAALTAKVDAYCKHRGITVNLFYETVFSILLSAYSQTNDIIVGSPIDKRNHEKLEPMLGCFSDTMLMRFDVDDKSTFKEYLSEVQKDYVQSLANGEINYSTIVNELGHERSLAFSPVHQIRFTLLRNESEHFEFDELSISELKMEETKTKFDLSFQVFWSQNSVDVGLLYSTDIFEKDTIMGFVDFYSSLLEQVLEDDSVQVSTLLCAEPSDVEEQLLLAGGNVQSLEGESISSLFSKTAEQYSQKVALICEEQELTFTELDRRVTALSSVLLNTTPAGEYIGLYLNRSIDTVVAMLAALKAGVPYIPLEPGNPRRRNEMIIKDAGINTIIYHSDTHDKISFFAGKLLNIESDIDTSKMQPAISNKLSTDVAYTIYTSGSTGLPKGVLNTHKNLLNFYYVFKEQLDGFNMEGDNGWLWVSSYAFDASLKGLIAVILGNTVVIPTEHEVKHPATLAKLIKNNDIKVFNATPLLMEFVLPELIASDIAVDLIVSGDNISQVLVKDLHSYCERVNRSVINAYGPTEATVNAAFTKLLAKEPISIGKPTVNTQLYILNGEQHFIPKGAIGELYIAGECLASGYLNRDELTHDSFIPCPWDKNKSLFRTGDLVRYLPNGNIQFISRNDDQVKVRGYRVELGEVAAHIRGIDSIIDAAVTINGKDLGVNTKIVAYFVTKKQSNSDCIESKISQSLPGYMMPDEYIPVDEIPKTPGGKVDFNLLKQIKPSNRGNLPNVLSHDSDIEQKLRNIWCSILSVESISDSDNFFQLGGHSLLAMKLIGDIKEEFDVNMELRDLFSLLTFSSQIDFLESQIKCEGAINSTSLASSTIEEQLSKIWCQVLNLDEVDVKDNFFQIGGHSLLAMKLIAEIKETFEVSLELRELFSLLTLESQIEWLADKLNISGADQNEDFEEVDWG
ncbi:hypothetical protein PCIT_a3831 [Pseudoalteromonas citrea]|uniref:Carrier domain-containing protein n=2 Tax=Pseudoalteromonas citrea TaxID=43655 RepID=A0AAD4AGK5_9GAMM|nr:non-ribosomal peptide synthetase [Pseudoalteromonas citrea]KAF7767743.1 hypothetical protein PCIT_a3831 [Pseudoalteromonas citrea]